MSSEPVKFTEVMDKRLLEATPKGRKKFIYADSYNGFIMHLSVVLSWSKLIIETAVFVSDIIGLV